MIVSVLAIISVMVSTIALIWLSGRVTPAYFIEELMFSDQGDVKAPEPESPLGVVEPTPPFPDLHIWNLSDVSAVGFGRFARRARLAPWLELLFIVGTQLLLATAVFAFAMFSLTQSGGTVPGDWSDLVTASFFAPFLVLLMGALRVGLFGTLRGLPSLGQISLIVVGVYWVGRLMAFIGPVMLIAVSEAPLWLQLAAVLLYLALLVFIPGRLLHGWLQGSPEPRALQVLRVFGDSDRSALFTGKLFDAWVQQGPVFTISSLDSEEAGRGGLNNLLQIGFIGAMAMGLLLPWVAVFERGDEAIWTAVPTMIVACTVIYVAFHYSVRFAVRRRFHSTPGSLASVMSRARRLHPLRRIFGQPKTFCTNNFWQRAVWQVMDDADVLLLDLRGFTPSNAGTSWELQQVTDRFDMNHLLILVDSSTDLEFTESRLRECWRNMRKASPNAGLERVHFYLLTDRYGTELPGLLQAIKGTTGGELNQWLASPELAGQLKDMALADEVAVNDAWRDAQDRLEKRRFWLSFLMIPACWWMITDDMIVDGYGMPVFFQILGWIFLPVFCWFLVRGLYMRAKRLKAG